MYNVTHKPIKIKTLEVHSCTYKVTCIVCMRIKIRLGNVFVIRQTKANVFFCILNCITTQQPQKKLPFNVKPNRKRQRPSKTLVKFRKRNSFFHLPLELWPSCRSGLGAKSEPIPDDPLDRVGVVICFGKFAPTIRLFRHRRNSVAARFPFDRWTVS